VSEKTELTLPERAAVALGTPKYEKELRELVAQSATLTEVKNKAAREQVHTAAMKLLKSRTGLVAVGDAATEDAKAFTKAVKAEVARLLEISTAEEKRLFALRDAWDEVEAAEKAAKAAAEKARVDGIRAKIETFMLDAVTAAAGTVAEIDAHATNLSERVISLEEFGEFASEAQAKRDNTVKWLRERHQQAIEREAEATRVAAEQARLAEERAALERERAEAAERERIAEEARQAQAKKDREELAARQAEIAEQERKAREAREAEEARLQEIREEQEATRRAAQAAAEEAMRRQQEEHEARMAAERDEIARQQAEIAAAKAEQERIAREMQEAAEATARAEAERIAAEQAAIAQAEADRIFAEQQQIESERQAAEMERIRREQIEFTKNGPGDVEMVRVIAEHYDVELGDAVQWLKKFDHDAADEQLAAENVAANRLEKAA
jgi:hypothetical protein